MTARVGDTTIEDVVSGTISVNLYDNPEDDEINAWRVPQPCVFRGKQMDKIDRSAIEEARRMHRADVGEMQIAAAE